MNRNTTWGLGLIAAACVAAIGLIGCATAMAAESNNGTSTFVLPTADCYPNVSDFDWAYKIQDGADAVVWWCDTAKGLQFNWRTGNYGNASGVQISAILARGRDLIRLDRETFHRPSTFEEMEVVRMLEQTFEPHCYPDTTYENIAVYSSTSQQKLGVRRIGADRKQMALPATTAVSCKFKLDEPKRYCRAWNLTASNGETTPADSWVLCRMERSPVGGWSDT